MSGPACQTARWGHAGRSSLPSHHLTWYFQPTLRTGHVPKGVGLSGRAGGAPRQPLMSGRPRSAWARVAQIIAKQENSIIAHPGGGGAQ